MKKLVHVVVINGTPKEMAELKDELSKIDFNADFLITNENIKLRDVKYLIDQLKAMQK